MLTLILFILLIVSFLGIVLMVWKKIPELQAIEKSAEQTEAIPLKVQVAGRIKEIGVVKNFNSEKLLKKFFFKTKILLIKAERKIDQCLKRVSHSPKFKDDYWDDLKKK